MENKDNLDIYNKLKEVPEEAKKPIKGGRLNGMTDIKPMWRIEKLTEIFGMCGIGWKAPIKNKEIIEGANGEKVAIVDIDLYVIILKVAIRNTINAIIKKHSQINKISIIITFYE